MRSKSMFALGLSVIAGAGAVTLMPSGARAALLISDSFNRPDSASLGSTDQGKAWVTYHFSGAVAPTIKDGALLFSGPPQNDMPYVSGAPAIGNFVMEYDVKQTAGYTQNGAGLKVNFRMATVSGQVSDGGNSAGYSILIAPASTTTNMLAYLYSDYPSSNGIIATGTQVTASAASQVHVKLQAEGNHIQAWINGTQTIDFTDTSTNPAAANNFAGGYFSFNANANKAFAFDNMKISEVPEPASAALLAIAGAGLLVRRRR